MVFRVTTQRTVLVFLIRTVQSVEIVIPSAVMRCQAREEVVAEVGEVVRGTVTLAVGILELITQLQEGGTPERFAVRGLHGVAILLCGRDVKSVGLVRRVVAEAVLLLIEAHVVGGECLAVRIGIAEVAAQSDVASARPQLPVELEHGSHLLRLAMADLSRS